MKTLVATLFLIAASVCTSTSRAEDTSPRSRAEAMFASFKPGGMDRAIEQFAQNSLMKPELVDSLQSQVRTQIPANNPVLGFEFISEQNVGQSVKRLTYVLKTASEPLFWNFSFYKPTNTWIPLRITFSGEY